MSKFITFFQLGFDHILDLGGFDHMLFLLVLVVSVSKDQYRKLLILITAFTLGHCLSLYLVSFDIKVLSSKWIEILILLSIVLSAIIVFFDLHRHNTFSNYWIVLFFGLIHGLGFGTYLQSILFSDEQVWQQLLYFNLGLEVGQILAVVIMIVLCRAVLYFFQSAENTIRKLACSVAFFLSAYLLLNTL